MQSTWLIIIVIILIILSSLFSASETAYSSLNTIRIKKKAKNGDKKAKETYKLSMKFSNLITAILIGNNIVNITASTIMAYLFAKYFGAVGILYATIILTIIIIVFGEVIPKVIAKENAEATAIFMVKPLKTLIFITKPIGNLVQCLEKHYTKKDKKVTATEDELLEIVQTIEFEGVLNQVERELIESAIEFDDKVASDVMTKKLDVVFIYEDDNIDTVKDVLREYRYSRIPVVDRKTGKVVGVIREADVLDTVLSGEEISIKKLLKEAIYITSRKKLPVVLSHIQKSRAHMAIVVDNYKTLEFLGIVTLEDVLEEIVGEIYDEYDDVPNNIVEIGHHSYEVDPNVKIKEFFKKYVKDVKLPKTKMQTFTGWLKELNNEKQIWLNDIFKYENIIMKVSDIKDGNIYKLDIDILSKEHEL